ncbi:hypothetical protein T12_10153 [Trichinella patagoniensis]|uniref:Uncharacterized protein n=1 Tax=Trichinella patagoniensis TaxID=990121 RepID=A0A0V0Z152_9BILA|nr:hypothetical protein T12_10153 [Trichinella patagoniensis]
MVNCPFDIGDQEHLVQDIVQALTSGQQITTFALNEIFVVARAETTSQDDQSIIGYRVTLSIAYRPRSDGTHKPQHHLGAVTKSVDVSMEIRLLCNASTCAYSWGDNNEDKITRAAENNSSGHAQFKTMVDLCSTDETTLMRFSTNRIHEWIKQQHTTTCRFRNHRAEYNAKRQLRSLACHGYFYTSVVVRRFAFRPTFARLTSAVIHKQDLSNQPAMRTARRSEDLPLKLL